jgi:hypothetical protein
MTLGGTHSMSADPLACLQWALSSQHPHGLWPNFQIPNLSKAVR